jgi:putative restriction endonuclease
MDFGQLKIGRAYSRNKLENIFDMGFGIRGPKGIVNRKDKSFIIIFSRALGPYADSFLGIGNFQFIGEGLKGDQKLERGNKALANSLKKDIPIYCFRQESNEKTWQYVGLVRILDYRYKYDGKRMVYVFEIEKINLENYGLVEQEKNAILNELSNIPYLKETTKLKSYQCRIRSVEFSRRVKDMYKNTCAICGKSMYSPEGLPEVESAHIYPKSKKGSDDLRNGIALCHIHHWAFDAGWFNIKDDLTIEVNKKSKYLFDELKDIDGKMILVPDNPNFIPHKLFLNARRKLFKF